MKKLTGLSLSLLALAVQAALVQAADTTDSVTHLPPVQVTGSELAQDARLESLARQQANSLKDVFRNDPSVSIGGGPVNAQRIYLNGVEGSNLNITLDGARQGRNLHQHRGGMSGLDPALLKRVEVQSGTAGNRGPGALGGAIHFETVDAQDLLQDDQVLGARLRLGYASADESAQLGAQVYGRFGQHLGLLASASGVDREDYRTGGGFDVPLSAGDDRNYLLKLSLLELAGHELRASVNSFETSGIYQRGSNGSDAGYHNPSSPNSGPTALSRQEVTRTSYVLDHRYQGSSPLLNWSANLYRNDNELVYPGAGIEPISTEETGFSLGNEARFDLGMTRHQLSVGLDYMDETAKTNQISGTPAATNAGLTGVPVEFTAENLGLFIEDQVQLGQLQITLGARLDDYTADYGPVQLDDSDISPHLGLDYSVTDAFSLFAGYHEAVRASGIIPVQWLGRIHAGTRAAGGALQAETSEQLEAGMRYVTRGLLLGDDHFSASLRYYQTELSHLVEMPGGGNMPAHCIGAGAGSLAPGNSNPAACIAAGQNAKPYDITGWTLALNWQWQAFSTHLTLAISDIEQDGEPVAVVRRSVAPQGDRLTWDNRWQLLDNLVLGYTLTAVDRLTDVPAGAPERTGYAVHDVQATWQVLPQLDLGLAVHNLFDKQYADHTTLANGDDIVAEPGRDVRVSAVYRF